MSDGVYRKTGPDINQTDTSVPSSSQETVATGQDIVETGMRTGGSPAKNRITAVIKDGTIQVGYTPVVETLAASIKMDETPVGGEERIDTDTSPGFKLAAAIQDPVEPVGERPVDDPMNLGAGQASAPEEGQVAQPDGAAGIDERTAKAIAKLATDPDTYPKTGTHPRVVLLVMTLLSWGGFALMWGYPTAGSLRLVQLPIPLLIHAGLMALVALWFARTTDRWGPVPFSLSLAITATTLVMPVINVWLGGPGLGDVHLYHQYGSELLQTGFIPLNPAPEYPPLAVWAFGLMAWITQTLHTPPSLSTSLVMALPGLVMWALLGRSRHAWMVAFIGLLPWSIMWQVIRFDVLPTALLVFALVLVRPDKHVNSWRVLASALLFGLAAAAKWHPGLAAIVLFFGFLSTQQFRHAVTMCLGSIVGFMIPHFPWILDAFGRQALLDAYLFHAGRGVTGESLIWQFLHPLGMAGMPDYAWSDSPDLMAGFWPTLLVVAVLLLVNGFAYVKPHMAWTTAAIAPALWLMANRIFSVQFVLTITVLWVVVLAFQPRIGMIWRAIFLFSLAVLNVTNWMIWPVIDTRWPFFSAVTFLFLVPLSLWVWFIGARAERNVGRAGRHLLMTEPVKSS